MDNLESTDWLNFKMKFQIQLTNPKDYLAAGVDISSYIQDGKSTMVYAKSPTVEDSFKVLKWSSASASDV